VQERENIGSLYDVKTNLMRMIYGTKEDEFGN
jgi:hypothetical protein